jgi:hypothetical protein
LTFFDTAPVPKSDYGHYRTEPATVTGLTPSTHACNAGYFFRVGLEARARLNGWPSIVSDTTDNLPSANDFICAGYWLCRPQNRWAWRHTLYWRKFIGWGGGVSGYRSIRPVAQWLPGIFLFWRQAVRSFERRCLGEPSLLASGLAEVRSTML